MTANEDVPTRSVRLESDEFACAAYSIAQTMTKAGVESYLYCFSYVDPGKCSRLGAHHGEELFILSDSFPDDWERTNGDKHLGDLLRGYWTEFVKTGDPNFDDAPRWPPFDSKSGEHFEIEVHVGLRSVLNASEL
jgi:para-nitrobenzyl esterase